MIIAIDGPAASGKGTLGKRLAVHYGLRHLDTGLIYRAVAKALLDAGRSPENRARAVADGLKANSGEVEIQGDDLIVHGMARARGGGIVTTHMDHRIAMAFLAMGLASEKPVAVDDAGIIATSFPGFPSLMRSLGAELS